MKWKEFLRLDLRKILITIVLGVIIFLLAEIVMKIGVSFTFFINISSPELLYPAITLTNVFYWYLLSCLIIWVYEKTKKK